VGLELDAESARELAMAILRSLESVPAGLLEISVSDTEVSAGGESKTRADDRYKGSFFPIRRSAC